MLLQIRLSSVLKCAKSYDCMLDGLGTKSFERNSRGSVILINLTTYVHSYLHTFKMGLRKLYLWPSCFIFSCVRLWFDVFLENWAVWKLNHPQQTPIGGPVCNETFSTYLLTIKSYTIIYTPFVATALSSDLSSWQFTTHTNTHLFTALEKLVCKLILTAIAWTGSLSLLLPPCEQKVTGRSPGATPTFALDCFSVLSLKLSN